jgi:hypothetical protein
MDGKVFNNFSKVSSSKFGGVINYFKHTHTHTHTHTGIRILLPSVIPPYPLCLKAQRKAFYLTFPTFYTIFFNSHI